MRSSLASRLKAFSPPQLALVALGSLALAGVGLASSAGLIGRVDRPGRELTGGDQDLADGTPTFGTLTRYRVVTKQPKGAAGDGPAEVKRPAEQSRERSGVAKELAAATPAPAPAGGGEPSGGGGPGGNTGGAGPTGNTGGGGPKGGGGAGGAGGAGPKGDTGGAGPKVDADVGRDINAAGPKGDTGPGGPGTPPTAGTAAPAPGAPPAAPVTPAAPAVFVVKDSSGATAGTLVSGDPNAPWLTFLYKKRAFLANARTGALELPTVDTSYATDDCTGTPYAPLSRPASSVLRTANPSETGIYEFGQPVSLQVRSIWQPGENGVADKCLQYPYTNSEIAPLRELPASERPPTLTGPLKAVRAN